MNNLILGDGELGEEIISQTNWDYISRKRDNINFLDINTYFYYLYEYDTIVNCIGYTDTYSLNKDEHMNVNFKAVCSLVDFCNKSNKKIVQISTDYLYSQSISDASEYDIPVHAKNWYSYSKLLADGYVQTMADNYLLIRTSFKPKPFPYMRTVKQEGNFDYTDVIADLIIKLINLEAKGIFNVGTEKKTIHELAIRTKPDVIPMDKPLDESMPRDITMDISKMKKFIGGNND